MFSILEETVLNEMPQQIHGLATRRLDSPKENAKLYKTVKQDKSYQKFETKNNVTLYKRTRGKETEIFGLVEPDYVGYYVRYEKQDAGFIDVEWMTQVFVWAGNSPHTKDIPEYVFFNHVLSETGVVFSDGQQTERGERFWLRMIEIAFLKNLNVYLIDFVKQKIKRIDSVGDFRVLYYSNRSPWGKESSYQWLKVAIADFDLTWG